jgi:hypothetical protein
VNKAIPEWLGLFQSDQADYFLEKPKAAASNGIPEM